MSVFDTAPAVPLLTVQRQRILAFIRRFHSEHGFAPTVREIGDEVGMGASVVQHHLNQLQRMGWIRRHPNRSRALVVLDPTTGQP